MCYSASHCTFLHRKRSRTWATFVETHTTVSTGARLTGSLINLTLGACKTIGADAEIATRNGVIVDAGAIVLAGLERVTRRSGCVAVSTERRRIRTDSWHKDTWWLNYEGENVEILFVRPSYRPGLAETVAVHSAMDSDTDVD